MNTTSHKEYTVEGERLIFTNTNNGHRDVAAVRIEPFGIFVRHHTLEPGIRVKVNIWNFYGTKDTPVHFLPIPVDNLTPENLVEHLLRAGRLSAFRDINRNIRELEPKL